MSSLTSMDIDDNNNDHSMYFSNIETTYQAINHNNNNNNHETRRTQTNKSPIPMPQTYRPVNNILTSLKHNSTKKKKPSHFATSIDINLSKTLLTVGLAPNNNIIAYDPTTLKPIQQFKIKGPNFIRQITYSPIDNNLLSAIGKGGVSLHDVRVGNFGNAMSASGQQQLNSYSSHSLAFGLGGNLIANGMENGMINFYDIRNSNKLLGQYKDAHSDAVLTLTFDHNDPTKLYTASADGTASLYDVSASNEDDAFMMCYNANCDIIHTIPFRYNSVEYIVLITSVNTLTIWNVEDGECIVQYNKFPNVDYLLPNGYYDMNFGRIIIYGGTFNTHDIVQLSISLSINGGGVTNDPMERVFVDCIFTDSHYGLIRDICLINQEPSLSGTRNQNIVQFYSCGEDALITHWKKEMKYNMKHKRNELKRKGGGSGGGSGNNRRGEKHRR